MDRPGEACHSRDASWPSLAGLPPYELFPVQSALRAPLYPVNTAYFPAQKLELPTPPPHTTLNPVPLQDYIHSTHGKEMDLLRTTVKVPGKRPPRAISAFGPSASINGLVKDMSTVQMGEGPGKWGPQQVPREGDRDRGRWQEELVPPWLCGVAAGDKLTGISPSPSHRSHYSHAQPQPQPQLPAASTGPDIQAPAEARPEFGPGP